MCLGIPAHVVDVPQGSDLVSVRMAGADRLINAGLLDDRPRPGDWLLVHMGFALSPMTAQEADEAMATLSSMAAERTGTARPEDAPW
jgi:hydrogenase expression/formation protein HypC